MIFSIKFYLKRLKRCVLPLCLGRSRNSLSVSWCLESLSLGTFGAGEGRLACLLVLNPQCEIRLSCIRVFFLCISVQGHVAGVHQGPRRRKDGQGVPGWVRSRAWKQCSPFTGRCTVSSQGVMKNSELPGLLLGCLVQIPFK